MTAPTGPAAPRAARLLGATGRALITAGVVVLLFVAYQLWGTNLQEARAQNDLRREFDEAIAAASARPLVASAPREIDAGTDPGEVATLPDPVGAATVDPAVLALFFPEDGDAVARLEIPSIGVDKIVVDGVQVADLRRGPGHYDTTAAVGTPGNTAIAGHRTTYGAPFNRIDELRPGDRIHLTGALGRFTYRVLDPADAYGSRLTEAAGAGDGHLIVTPDATWVLGDFGDDRLTLTACHPKLSSRQRIIVAAELEGTPVDPDDLLVDLTPAADTPTADTPTDPDPTAPDPTAPDPTGSDQAQAEPVAGGGDDTAAGLSLDEGLDGERGALVPGIAWLVVATAVWVGAGAAARRRWPPGRERLALRVASLLPVAVALWFAFEHIDRALPAA